MIFISITDTVNMLSIGFAPGVMLCTGHIYCSDITLSYFHGQTSLLLYIWTCFYTVLLSVNRCLAIARPKLEEALFDGWKVFAWAFGIFLGNLYFYFTATILLFRSVACHFVYNPYFGFSFKDDGEYSSAYHYYGNLLSALFVLFTYSVFAVFYLQFRKKNQMVFGSGRADGTKSMFASVFINAIILCITNITYNAIEGLDVFDFYYKFSLVSAILYYILNLTIKGIVQNFWIYKIFQFKKSTTAVEKLTTAISKNTVI
uniref:7TM_GPCR_Srx domain-containing protein n=1 Tax=Rhabditophanes sp. KR3021 TaxID=114890 RepID=A0AC35TQN3_9BILA